MLGEITCWPLYGSLANLSLDVLRLVVNKQVCIWARFMFWSFFIGIIKLWNDLPKDIVEAGSFQSFKVKLKLYLDA